MDSRGEGSVAEVSKWWSFAVGVCEASEPNSLLLSYTIVWDRRPGETQGHSRPSHQTAVSLDVTRRSLASKSLLSRHVANIGREHASVPAPRSVRANGSRTRAGGRRYGVG